MDSNEFNIDNLKKQDDLNEAELVNLNSFERLKSKNRAKKLKRKIFYIFISVFLVALIALVCVFFFFGTDYIKVVGNDRYSAEDIISVSSIDKSKNLVFTDYKSAKKAILSSFPYVNDVSFKIVLPSTLVIQVEEDAPVWYTDILGDWFVLSKDLRVIAKYDMKEAVDVLSLPITYIKLPQVSYCMSGERIKFQKAANYDYIVSFLNSIRDSEIYDDLDSIDISDRYHISAYILSGRYEINLGTADNIETKIKFVDKVLQDSTFSSTSIASINVEDVKKIVVSMKDELFRFP